MIFLTAMDFTLPLADPVLKFLIILLIILGAPLLLNKIRIPPLLGLIIAGAVIGPHGFNLVLRDSSIILSGTAGLLYIMFLAGLEIDMGDFKRNSLRSLTFGLYTFCVPMALGIVAGYYLLGFSWLTSVLLASMFASHTLIAYPIISKLGISKNNAVCITVGGTMITDTLALLVLTIVVALSTGNADDMFWVRLGLSITAFTLFVLLGFPLIGRWFFKRVHDNISQYIFVLAMVFLGAFLAQLAGLEAIIGSFLAGLALNRLIPATSPLMNRVEFVGNAIFIPFFLLSVGMLIDYRAFFTSFETIKVGAVMIVVATAAKFIAAWLTQKTFRMSVDQRHSGNDARRRADPAAERERAQRYDSDDSGHLYDGVVFSAEGGAQYRYGGVDGRRGTRPERGGDTHSGQQPGQRRGAGQPGAVAQAEARQERIACAHRRR